MIKVVFFDLDDTLYDHAGIVEATLHKLRERLPQIAKHSNAEVLELYHRLLEQYHKHYIKGTWPFEEAHRRRWQAMLDHWAISDVDPEEMRLLARAILRKSKACEWGSGIAGSNSFARHCYRDYYE